MQIRQFCTVAGYLAFPLLGWIGSMLGDGPSGGLPIAVFFGPPVLLATLVGWWSEWSWCAIHALAMATVGVVSFWMLSAFGIASPHSVPVTIETLPWFYAFFLAFLVPSLFVGRVARWVLNRPGPKLSS